MSNLFWLTEPQLERFRPFFAKIHGRPHVDEVRVLSGIMLSNHYELRRCDAPKAYGPAKTLYSRLENWGELGVFARIMDDLA